MSERSNLRSGGQILIDALKVHRVDTVFCVPGESYLEALDAFYDARQAIRLVTCRHESGATFMAEAYGKLTGRPGVSFVTRGPGACNGSIGLHTGLQDSTPMVLFVGQVGRGLSTREALQEIDFRHMYGPLAKWVGQVEDPARIPEMVSHAFHLAVSGRPGPVVLVLPEDMLRERAAALDTGSYAKVQASPAAQDLERLRELLAAARRPLMVVGGGGWTAEACADIMAFAEANDLPTACSFRCQDRFDNRHRNYIGDLAFGGNPALFKRAREADLVLAAGPRLGEVTTQGYTLLEAPNPRQTLIHVHAGAEELGRVFQAELMINAGPLQFAAAARALEPVDAAAWAVWAREGHEGYLANLEPDPCPGDLDMGAVMKTLEERLPADAIVANDGGNFSGWVHRFHRYTVYPSQLGPTNGAMGYGLPAAIAAKVTCPERQVICFSGDGGFLMTGNELATAMQENLALVVLVINNGLFGTIRMHQERDHPGRIIATDLVNPDFAAYAASFGAHGETVERTEDFAPAFERAMGCGGPALLDLRIDPEAITTRTTLSALRAAAEGGTDRA
jgi:acetolactate synthase-1/2/3 large subunit